MTPVKEQDITVEQDEAYNFSITDFSTFLNSIVRLQSRDFADVVCNSDVFAEETCNSNMKAESTSKQSKVTKCVAAFEDHFCCDNEGIRFLKDIARLMNFGVHPFADAVQLLDSLKHEPNTEKAKPHIAQELPTDTSFRCPN